MTPNCLLLLLASILCSFTGFTQTSINISGQEASGAGGTASISIGQTFFQYQSDGAINLTEGVQQVYEITSVGTETYGSSSNVQIKVFPNPTQHMLFVEVDLSDVVSLKWVLSDLKGVLLKSGVLSGDSREIMVHDLPAGTYFLMITDTLSFQNTFKIVKTN